MRARITVLTSQLSSEILKKELQALSQEVEIAEDTYTFSPRAGRLFDVLTLLKQHNTIYQTYFNNTDESDE
jgi:hypothetical protein